MKVILLCTKVTVLYLCNAGVLFLKVWGWKGEEFYLDFLNLLAQTMHQMRPGGVTHLHISCLQYTGLLAVNSLGKIHYQLFLLDSNQNPAHQTSFTTLRCTLTQAHILIWYSQHIYLVHHPIRRFLAATCLLTVSRVGVCSLNEINYYCVAEPNGSRSYTFSFPFRR